MPLIRVRIGSEQKTSYLPEMAEGRYIGCFGLTREPDAGSNPAGTRTTAVRGRQTAGSLSRDEALGSQDWQPRADRGDPSHGAKVGGRTASVHGFISSG